MPGVYPAKALLLRPNTKSKVVTGNKISRFIVSPPKKKLQKLLISDNHLFYLSSKISDNKHLKGIYCQNIFYSSLQFEPAAFGFENPSSSVPLPTL